MVCQKVVLNIKFGLHARPAGVLSKLAQKYQSDIKMKINEKAVNVKTIMGVMSAGVQCGTQVEFVCDGIDEKEALQDIVAAVQNGLGEK
ncbi:HPr family phosphocarrier protein [Oscillospiraceae bacterium PP1C4]